jgi:hypothetical protein
MKELPYEGGFFSRGPSKIITPHLYGISTQLLHLAARHPVQPVISRSLVLVESSPVLLEFSQSNRSFIHPYG